MTDSEKRLKGRLALVTGASRGIGAAIARRYAAEGAQLILVARSTGGLEEVDDEIHKISGKNATLVPLDLTDMDAIDQMGAALFERFGRLDVLVGNAGILGTIGPIHQATVNEWQDVIDLNLTSQWRLLRTCDPLIRASDAGRVIFVTSGAARGKRPFWSSYAVSKAGLEMMVRTYAAENEKFHIRANLVDPGAVRTTMRALAYPGEDPETLPAPDDVTDVFVDLAEEACDKSGEVVQAR